MKHRKPIIALIICAVLILITPTMWRGYWRYMDNLVLSKVDAIEKELESYYQQYGYYPEANALNDFSNQNNNFWIQDYKIDPNTRQIFDFIYYLPSEFNFWQFPAHKASSCDTRGFCERPTNGGIDYYTSNIPQQMLGVAFPRNSDNRQGKIILNKLQALSFTNYEKSNYSYPRNIDVKSILYDSNYFKSLKIFDNKYLGDSSEKVELILQAVKEGSTDIFYKACDESNKCFNVDVKVTITKGVPFPHMQGMY